MLIVIIYLAFIALGLPDSLLGAAWPVMHIDIHAPIYAAGYSSLFVFMGTITSSLVSSFMLRKFGTGPVTLVSVLLTAAALTGIVNSHSFISVLLWEIPLGLGAGGVDVGLNHYVATHFKARHMSWLHSCWGVGAAAGPVVLSLFLTDGGWRVGYMPIIIALFAVSFVLFISLPLWRGNERTSDEVKNGAGLMTALRRRGVKSALAAFFCYCAFEGAMGTWTASYLVNVHHFSPSKAAEGAAIFFGSITAGRFITGFLSAKSKPRTLINAGLCVAAAGGAVLVTRFELAGVAMLGLGGAPFYPLTIHETPARFGTRYSSAVISLQMAMSYFAFSLSPLFTGGITKRFGFGILPAVVVCLAAATFILSNSTKNTCLTNADSTVDRE